MQWHSIPLNRNKRQVPELTPGGGMRVVAVERLEAAKAVAGQEEPLSSGPVAGGVYPSND